MKTFVVLGMHRSATSLIGKNLYHSMYVGDSLIPPSGHNKFGYYEDCDFVTLNESILSAAGGCWRYPPSEDAILALKNRFEYEISNLINYKNERAIEWLEQQPNKDMYKCPLWGWKDPRTTLTIKLYLPYLSEPHFICCFRNPTEVAKSLIARGDLDSFQDAYNLALIYNERLIKFLQENYTQKFIPEEFDQ